MCFTAQHNAEILKAFQTQLETPMTCMDNVLILA